MRNGHSVVRWEVTLRTSQNDAPTAENDEEKLNAEPCRDDDMFRPFISNAYGDGDWCRVLCVGVNVIFVFTFDARLQLLHFFREYSFDGLVLG